MRKEFRMDQETYTWLLAQPEREEALEIIGGRLGFIANTMEPVLGKGPRIFTAIAVEANPGGGKIGEHLIAGHFKSDKYSWCPVDFVPLKLTDKMAQPVLWEYAQQRKSIDLAFAKDLETALVNAGFEPPSNYFE